MFRVFSILISFFSSSNLALFHLELSLFHLELSLSLFLFLFSLNFHIKNPPNSQKKLHSPLRSEVARRLVAAEGDVSLADGCGLSEADRAALRSSKRLVFVHSAASIYFTDHVHDLIKMNYGATRNVLELADAVSSGGKEASLSSSSSSSSASSSSPITLAAFIHVSTAYVNANRPAGTRVKEILYSLVDEGGKLDARTRKRLGLVGGAGGGAASSKRTAASSPLVLDHGALMRSLLAIEDRGAAAKVAQKVVDALG